MADARQRDHRTVRHCQCACLRCRRPNGLTRAATRLECIPLVSILARIASGSDAFAYLVEVILEPQTWTGFSESRWPDT